MTPPGTYVTLTDDEFHAAWLAGEARHRHHCERKRVAVHAAGLKLEGIGAVAEAAVAKLFGEGWNDKVGQAHYGSDDTTVCGVPVEVKATDYTTGRLLIYERTPREMPVIMVVITGRDRVYYPTVRVAGWMYARDGRRAEWWRADFKTPCWAVPQSELRPIETLKANLSCTQSAF